MDSPDWLWYGVNPKGNVSVITFGRFAKYGYQQRYTLAPTSKEGPLLHRIPVRDMVNRIVTRMHEKGHPVEALNKNGHKPDYIPTETYGNWVNEPSLMGNTYELDNFGMALVGGYHSKYALVQLVIEAYKAGLEQGAANAPTRS